MTYNVTFKRFAVERAVLERVANLSLATRTEHGLGEEVSPHNRLPDESSRATDEPSFSARITGVLDGFAGRRYRFIFATMCFTI